VGSSTLYVLFYIGFLFMTGLYVDSFTGGGFAQIVLLMYLHTYFFLSKARKALL